MFNLYLDNSQFISDLFLNNLIVHGVISMDFLKCGKNVFLRGLEVINKYNDESRHQCQIC